MGLDRIKIGVLTSSRADFGIYLPLLNIFKGDSDIELRLITFGSHHSKQYGETIREIQQEGFNEYDSFSTLLSNDDEVAISTSYGLTAIKFAEYWKNHEFDLVFCLGDRFEMAAAVASGVPFGIRFVHIHGGETTLGAMDNVFRHQITMASSIHFTSTDIYRDRVISLKGNNENIYSIGALSLDGMDQFQPVQKDDFFQEYGLPEGNFVLVTVHPETIQPENNRHYSSELYKALRNITDEFNVLITLPNADTLGSLYRNMFLELKNEYKDKVIVHDSLGKTGYFNAMKYCSFLLGNTSSGIIEAASFGKYVVNLGDRQLGRVQSGNIVNSNFLKKNILEAVSRVSKMGEYCGDNLYYAENSAERIHTIIKKILQ